MGKADRVAPGRGDVEVIESVHQHRLPESLKGVLEAYDLAVGERDRFLWRWGHHLFPKFTLSCVDPESMENIRDAKLLGLIFVSVLDDMVEKHTDRTTFEEASKIPFDHQTVNPDRERIDRAKLEFAQDVWTRFSAALDDGPMADEFEAIFRFDLKQILNAIDYSYVANQNLAFVNEVELGAYDAHNMMLFAFADLDLAYSPTFDRTELASLRRVIRRAQRMVRIGNWISTWERELGEDDVTSGVVVYALQNDIVSVADLRALQNGGDENAERIADRIREHDVEDVFLREWHEELTAARAFEPELNSVDVGAYLDGIETVMEYHLASRGLK